MGIGLYSRKDPMTKYSLISEINSLTFGHFLRFWDRKGPFLIKMSKNQRKIHFSGLLLHLEGSRQPGGTRKAMWAPQDMPRMRSDGFYDKNSLQTPKFIKFVGNLSKICRKFVIWGSSDLGRNWSSPGACLMIPWHNPFIFWWNCEISRSLK